MRHSDDGKVYVKFVHKARMWCKTAIEYDERGSKKQKQEWSLDKPKI